MKIIKDIINFHPIETAKKAVKSLMSDPQEDWEYKLIDCHNGLARIEVYDEDGILVGKGL
ncbi:MAG: hypothetical protein ACXAC2_03715 [Candidatus Kariarchaeaceae archaeon]|jgi:hypothetical protein